MPEKRAKRMLDEFRVRDDSNRAKLLHYLALKFGNQVPLQTAMDEAYGTKKGSKQTLKKTVDGLNDIIDARKLGYEIRWVTTRRGKSIGIYEQDNGPSAALTQRATAAQTAAARRTKS